MGFWKVTGWIGFLFVTGHAVTTFLGDEPVVVQKIVDGDTIDVALDGETTRVRFLNVDTPEIGRNGQPSECLAEEARARLEELLPEGSEVKLEYDTEKHDKYGRTLAGVFYDGKLINAEIAREGLGVAIDIEPNHRFYAEVKQAEDEAKSAGTGISTLGPECKIATSDVAAFREAQEALEAAQQFQLGGIDLSDDGDFTEAGAMLARLAAARTSLQALDHTFDRQSEFQKAAYGDDSKNEIQQLQKKVGAEHRSLERKVKDEEQSREERAEKERLRAEREARAEAERTPEQTSAVPGNTGTRSPSPAHRVNVDPIPQPAPSGGGGGGDEYTGCRAYGGNYVLNSIDKNGKRYAKIDCTTKVQIG